MDKGKKKQRFSDVWCTLTQLGAHFCMSAREIGQKLTELELRTYDQAQGGYVPSVRAFAEGLCVSASLRNKKPYYMWHCQKVTHLLQTRLQMKALSEEDVENREMALKFIQMVKNAELGNGKLMFFDTIEAKQLPTMIAWALIEAKHESTAMYELINQEISKMEMTVITINDELERLGSTMRLDVIDTFEL